MILVNIYNSQVVADARGGGGGFSDDDDDEEDFADPDLQLDEDED